MLYAYVLHVRTHVYQANMLKQKLHCCFIIFVCLLLYVILFLAVSLLNGATVIVAPVDILSFVSVGHVVENARLVDVDDAATVVCKQPCRGFRCRARSPRTFLLPSDPPQHQSLHTRHDSCCGEKCSW